MPGFQIFKIIQLPIQIQLIKDKLKCDQNTIYVFDKGYENLQKDLLKPF